MKEMQELKCHCGRVNVFPINTERDGNYIIVCRCGHQHCRVCENSVVTNIRWDSKGRTHRVKSTQVKYTQQELGRRDHFIAQSWLNKLLG
jgi:hypothetical protein